MRDKVSEQLFIELCNAYNQGYSLRKLARNYKLTYYKARKIIKDSGLIKARGRYPNNEYPENLQPRARRKVPRELENFIIKSYFVGKKVKDIAEVIGVSVQAIYYWLRKLGVNKNE